MVVPARLQPTERRPSCGGAYPMRRALRRAWLLQDLSTRRCRPSSSCSRRRTTSRLECLLGGGGTTANLLGGSRLLLLPPSLSLLRLDSGACAPVLLTVAPACSCLPSMRSALRRTRCTPCSASQTTTSRCEACRRRAAADTRQLRAAGCRGKDGRFCKAARAGPAAAAALASAPTPSTTNLSPSSHTLLISALSSPTSARCTARSGSCVQPDPPCRRRCGRQCPISSSRRFCGWRDLHQRGARRPSVLSLLLLTNYPHQCVDFYTSEWGIVQRKYLPFVSQLGSFT